MSKIVIDARESGTSTGRYMDKLIEHMHKLQSPHDITILTKPLRLDFMKSIAPRYNVVAATYDEFSFGEQIGFKKQIDSLRPDLVHFGMVQQPVLYHGRVVTTMHDLTTLRFKNPSKNPIIFTIKQHIYSWVNKEVARKSSVIITPTEFVKNDIVEFAHVNPNKIIVTYEAADKITDTAEPIDSLVGKQFIMYIGRPMPHKNLTVLIDAFALMQQEIPDLYLVLAGKKDALYETHEKYVLEKGIQNVMFTGHISDGQLRWLYEHTACYVFPSLSEGFGLPGLEAMAHGAPVASSNLSCLPEVYGNAAKYFDPRSSGGVAEAVLEVLRNKDLTETLRTNGYKKVQEYSWTKTAQQTFDIYNDLLK